MSSVGTVHIGSSTLASPDAAQLIAELNAELTTTFPEPGANVIAASDAFFGPRTKAPNHRTTQQKTKGDGNNQTGVEP
jgi:hypothetical protein